MCFPNTTLQFRFCLKCLEVVCSVPAHVCCRKEKVCCRIATKIQSSFALAMVRLCLRCSNTNFKLGYLFKHMSIVFKQWTKTEFEMFSP